MIVTGENRGIERNNFPIATCLTYIPRGMCWA